MDLQKEMEKAERKAQWHCPACKGTLDKWRKGASRKGEPLALGVRACQDCESVWFMQKMGR